MQRRHLLIPVSLLALVACSLPLNTALRDWSRRASFAVNRSEPGETEAQRSGRQALAAYFYALGILWDGAPLNFRPAEFAPAAPGAPPIQALAAALAAASADTPPRWLTGQVSSPNPAYEDQRLPRLIRAADTPVQTLLAMLREGAPLPQATVLARIGQGHALLLERADRLSQRETERAMLLALYGLAREMARLPPAPPQAMAESEALAPASLAAVFPP